MRYGHYKYLEIKREDIKKLVFLPQVRKTENEKLREIANSIRDRDLINNPDVALLTYDELKSHIDFLNELHEKKVNIKSFTTINDYYVVVIAGHNRLKAFELIPPSVDSEDTIVLKIHDVKTSKQILGIQLDENLHKEVNVEERAFTIIRIYRLGIRDGDWHDKSEFIALNKEEYKFSEDVVYDALAFANLSPKEQDFVFSNHIPYFIGVNLGRMFDLIVRFETATKEESVTIDQAIKLHYNTLLNNVKAAKSTKERLRVLRQDINLMTDYFLPPEVKQQLMMDLWKDGADRQGREQQGQKQKNYNKSLRNLINPNFEKMVDFLYKSQALTGIDHKEEIQNIQKLSLIYKRTRFGDTNE